METGAPEWEEGVRPFVQRLARDDRAAHDGRGRAGPLAPGTARQRDGGARRADRHGRGVGRPGAARPPDGDDLLLQSLVQGKTNAEIAGELGIDEQAVERRLGELFATIGASSRADATAFAFRERVL